MCGFAVGQVVVQETVGKKREEPLLVPERDVNFTADNYGV